MALERRGDVEPKVAVGVAGAQRRAGGEVAVAAAAQLRPQGKPCRPCHLGLGGCLSPIVWCRPGVYPHPASRGDRGHSRECAAPSGRPGEGIRSAWPSGVGTRSTCAKREQGDQPKSAHRPIAFLSRAHSAPPASFFHIRASSVVPAGHTGPLSLAFGCLQHRFGSGDASARFAT